MNRARELIVPLSILFVLILVLGCVGFQGRNIVTDQDIQVTKLDQNGSVEWSKTLDSGMVDFAQDIMQTSDSGFVISGGTRKPFCNNPILQPDSPFLTRLSKSGEILWANNYPGSEKGEGLIGTILDANDSVTALGSQGTIFKIFFDGTLNESHFSGIKVPFGTGSPLFTFIKTKDGGYILAGKTVAKSDKSLSLSWQSYRNNDFGDEGYNGIYAIRETNEDQGFLAIGYVNNSASVIRLTANGSAINFSPIIPFELIPRPIIQANTNGYSILYLKQFTFTPILVQVDSEGFVKGNLTISDMSTSYVPTDDGGYTFLNYPVGEDIVQQNHVSPNGTISLIKENHCAVCLRTIVPIIFRKTSDGGFVYLQDVRKERAC